MKKISIAIDGPSGAGKSTISDLLAKELNYTHLDTGAMYRAVAYSANQKGIAYDDEEALVKLIEDMDLKMPADGSVILENKDISEEIRTNEMSLAASDVSKLFKVREALVKMQQNISKDGGYILDGRDIGTVVLKDAEVKLYLTASAEARAQRRLIQNKKKGIAGDYETILEEINKRDYQDSHREHSPLTKADDAIEIDSSNLSIQEVVDLALEIINEKIK